MSQAARSQGPKRILKVCSPRAQGTNAVPRDLEDLLWFGSVKNPLVVSETSWLRLALRTRTNRKRVSSKSQKVNLPTCRSCLLGGIVPEPLVSFKLSLIVSRHLLDSGPGSVLTNCNQTGIDFCNSFSRWDRVFPEVAIYYLKTKG